MFNRKKGKEIQGILSSNMKDSPRVGMTITIY